MTNNLSSQNSCSNGICVLLWSAIIAIAAFTAGLIVGIYAEEKKTETSIQLSRLDVLDKILYSDDAEAKKNITDFFISNFRSDNLRKEIETLSKSTVIAGGDADKRNADYIANYFRNSGFDSVELHPYSVLISQSNQINPNSVTLFDPSGVELFSAMTNESSAGIDPAKDVISAYNANSPNAQILAEYVYVNYARRADFQKLADMGVDFSRKIVIARYGKIFPGRKVQNAEDFHAVGMVLYSDPNEVAYFGTGAGQVYPNSAWLPADGIRRGNVARNVGDPATPGWVSKPWVKRRGLEDLQEEGYMPSIPVQPVSYEAAEVLMSHLQGFSVPNVAEWSGKMPGLSVYKVGPSVGHTIKIKSNNVFSQLLVYNVIGRVEGAVEPDRYVVLGNHRDAWGKGVIDASTGTAAMLELARIVKRARRDREWVPRRSLVFCSWGATHHGMIGAQENAEEFYTELMDRAVTYLNIDTCSSGCKLQIQAAPILNSVTYTALKKISDPKKPNSNLYNTLKTEQDTGGTSTSSHPTIHPPTGNKNFAPWAHFLGIPSIDISWVFASDQPSVEHYPAQHTSYDTLEMLEILDPGLACCAACGQLSAAILLEMSESTVLPFDPVKLGEKLEFFVENLKLETENDLKKIAVYLDFRIFSKRIEEFKIQAVKFANRMRRARDDIKGLTPFELRALNDQLMLLERSFLDPSGFRNRTISSARHMITSPTIYPGYPNSFFPGVRDMIYKILYDPPKEGKREEKDAKLQEMKQQLEIAFTRAALAIDRATGVMKIV